MSSRIVFPKQQDVTYVIETLTNQFIYATSELHLHTLQVRIWIKNVKNKQTVLYIKLVYDVLFAISWGQVSITYAKKDLRWSQVH